MLEITIPKQRLFNEGTYEFMYVDETKLCLEHSLVSLSKWESKWHKPFISSEKSKEEIMDYIKFMTITKNVNPIVYNALTDENVIQIKNYIDDPMTATTFSQKNNGEHNSEIITAELIYYWMIELKIPVEFQKWHINRLITLIRVCEIKNTPPKKRSSREIASRTAAINAARRQKYAKKG